MDKKFLSLFLHWKKQQEFDQNNGIKAKKPPSGLCKHKKYTKRRKGLGFNLIGMDPTTEARSIVWAFGNLIKPRIPPI